VLVGAHSCILVECDTHGRIVPRLKSHNDERECDIGLARKPHGTKCAKVPGRKRFPATLRVESGLTVSSTAMMVDELCSGYESHTTASAASASSAPAVNGDSPEVVVVSSSPTMIRRSQSLPTSTTTADTILSTSQSTDRGEERFVVPHAKSEEQYVDRFGFITEHKEGQPRDSSSRSNNNNNAGNNKNRNNSKKEQKLAEQEIEREVRRVQKWTVMIDHWPALSVHRRKLIRRRLRKGLPDASIRQRVWPILLQLNERQPLLMAPPPPRGENGHAAASAAAADNDSIINNSNNNNHMSYGRLWRNNDNLQVQDIIERDIHRTFPKHSMFTSRSTDDAAVNGPHGQPVAAALDDEHDGQASLRRVLRAYSAYDTEIGYCQGMNFIAAVRTAYLIVLRIRPSITPFRIAP
jgi:Rab-GTPase-TBC domain